jgi:hypothetical protein
MDLDYNNDSWADWDEDCHGPMDTPSNRREYPEGFSWSCCKEAGDSVGCQDTTHEESRKRPRHR